MINKQIRPKLLVITTVPLTLKMFLLPIARHFRDKGWKVDALARGAKSDSCCCKEFNEVSDISWSRNPLLLGNVLKAVREVRSVLMHGEYDIVHVHTPIAAFIARFALRQLRDKKKFKVIYTAHGFHFYKGSPLENNIYLLLEKVAGRWTDYLITINNEDTNAAKKYKIVAHNKIIFMPGIGVDTRQFDPAKISNERVDAIHRELGSSVKGKMFLMVAEFNRGKRHADCLKAFARLGDTDIHLVFAGDGPLFTEVRRLAAKLQITTKVHFLGYRTDIPALIKSASAIILPSEREGLPRCVMESLSMEVPVIGADVRGIRDLIGGRCGILVPVGDVSALTRAMKWVVGCPEAAREMGRQGRILMRSQYDIARILERHEHLYEEALKA
jgi:glycosyltransferase involved in cell wall biosynthesis